MKNLTTARNTRAVTKTLAIILSVMLIFSAFILGATHAGAETTASTAATVTFQAGELELVTAPDIDFGSHSISGAAETYNAEAINGSIVVSDLRGSGEGWNLTASMSSFTDGTASSLNGAYVTIQSQTLSSETNAAITPTAATNIQLSSDNTSANILTAVTGTGLGQWTSELTTENTSLTVPAAAATVGNHAAVLTWTLGNTP